ncbi:MAG TPA: phosphopantetheine-binding protein, partial [Casimicrobiaceae bacterium]
ATDNFFVLGGDSLRGGQLLSRVRARFGVSLTLATLFMLPTPAQIAIEIANVAGAANART